MKSKMFIRTRILTIAILAIYWNICRADEPVSDIGNNSGTNVEVIDSLGDLRGNLDEFVLTVKKDLVKSDGAKLTYDMVQDDSSKGQSVLEALRKVPMVTVDGNDNIKIKGSSNFKIYVNGKEDPMLSANASTILKSMPAESVSKIEVITEPGAKYDAEGVGGILNLVTERTRKKDGYTGTLGASYAANNMGANAYFRFKHNKITADAGLTYATDRLQQRPNTQKEQNYDMNSDTYHLQKTRLQQKYSFDYINANLNFSWEASDRDLITWGGNLTWLDVDIRKCNNSLQMFSKSGELAYAYNQLMSGSMKNTGASGNASYKHSFNSNGHSIVATYLFNYADNSMLLKQHNVDLINYEIPEFGKSLNETFNREHTVTLDYTLPLHDNKHIIEVGGKGVFRNNSSIIGNTYAKSEIALDKQRDFGEETSQTQNIYAAYASYTGTYGKLNLKAGLRWEHTYAGLDFKNYEIRNFRRNLDDIVPNAAISWIFNPMSNLRLAYQMRINRPSVNNMNPEPFKITETYVIEGNPDLESEHYNSISLSYSNYGRTLGGNISFSYSQSDNTIEDYSVISNGTTFHRVANIGHLRDISINGYLNWNINNKMSLSGNAGVFKRWINAPEQATGEQMSNQGWGGNVGLNYNYTGPWDVKYSAYGGWQSRNITLQGWWSGWYYYGLSLRKDFLKDRNLSVTVNAGNFFTKYQYRHSYTATSGHQIYNIGCMETWNVGISISWTFGHLKENVKKTGANMQNDDTKTTGNSGGIGM